MHTDAPRTDQSAAEKRAGWKAIVAANMKRLKRKARREKEQTRGGWVRLEK